jgi:hypothetical protein
MSNKPVTPLHPSKDGMRLRREKQPVPANVNTTEHKGNKIKHHEFKAIQYEFYIPTLILGHPAVKLFIERLGSVELGATTIPELGGVWKGVPETTTIYRMVVHANRFSRKGFRLAVQPEIGKMMDELARDANEKMKQEAVLFTETKIHVNMSGKWRWGLIEQ